MADWKVTMFFEGGLSGWTESWYRSSVASAEEVLATAVVGGGLVQMRRQFLAAAYRVAYVRASNVDSPRDGLVLAFPGGTGDGIAPGGIAVAEQTFDAVNVRIYAGTQRWRNLLVRGLSTDTFIQNRLNPGSTILTSMPAFLITLKTGWRIRRTTRTGEVPLTSVQVDNNYITSFTTTQILVGAAAGATLQVRDARGMSKINGRYKIRSVGANNVIYIVQQKYQTYGTLSALNPGRISVLANNYDDVTALTVIGASSRRTGRPSYVPRGLRPARPN